MDYVYHGSSLPNLKIIKPHKSTHKKEWVYATPSKALATIFLSKNGSDLNYSLGGNGLDRPIELVERKPGMFKEIFSCDGYIYKLPAKTFMSGLTSWSGEVVSTEEVPVVSCEYIENVYDELLRLKEEHKINLYLYPNRPLDIPLDNSDLIPKVRAWEERGSDISNFFSLYPELKEAYYAFKDQPKIKR